MPNSKVKVLYIAGYERSGSTLLHNVLGQLDGFFAAGELNKIWDRSLIENRRCGCGTPFRECEVWREILAEGFGNIESINAHEMTRLCNNIRNRHFPLMLLPWNKRFLEYRLENFPEQLGKLYRAIQTTTSSKIIVDSSKSPTYGYALGTLPEIELYVVHLVRDPRSVQHSLLKRKAERHGGYLKHNSVKGSISWDTLNLGTEAVWRNARQYMRVQFEDFVRQPQEVFGRILDMMQEKVEQLPFEGNKIELYATHSCGGSPSRFNTGTIQLGLDETWKQEMKPSDKAIVTTLTRPLLSRYEYLNGGRNTSLPRLTG